MKKTLLILMMFLIGQTAQASRLPDDVWKYVQNELPKASQRFDSVILLDDGNMYIPLYPANRNDVEKISIEYTYPEGKTLKNKPEVVVFNNNYVLLKLFKDNKGNYTVTKKEDLPAKVKLGVMPQDMLVPTGMKIPESLKIVMGDLLIPSRGDNLLITTSDTALGTGEDDKDADIMPLVYLKNTKAFFVNTRSKFVLVYDDGGSKPLYEIKLNGLPNKIVASPLTKFALTMYFGSKTAEVMDLVNERVLTKIDFDNIPSDADLDKNSQIAYVTSAKAGAIYLVDLNSAVLQKTIKLGKAPDKISVSGDDKMLVFNDKNDENIYLMDLASGDFSVRKLANVPNLSTLLIGNKRVVAISRTENRAYIYKINDYDPNQIFNEETGEVETNAGEKKTKKNQPSKLALDNFAELVAELDLAEKPTDAVLYGNKVFILCSKDGIINVYDLELDKMLEPIALSDGGFYSKITLVPQKSTAIVTGINTKKIIVIDLENARLEKKSPAEIDVADVVLIDDTPRVLPAVQDKDGAL